MDLISLLLTLVIFGVVVWFALYLVALLPPPAGTVGRIVVAVLALVVLLSWFLGRGVVLIPLRR